ncbi:MAG: NADP-dependent malic enzyme [Candidatus Hydrogenedentota bacterium]
MPDYFAKSLELHRKTQGKLAVQSKFPLKSQDDLSMAYTPGVAAVCESIRDDISEAYPLTMKGNSVAVLSDGSFVLGLGNIGPEAALPVMEGKAVLFKEFADIDAIPLVVNTQSPEALIALARAIAPNFGGINLEDIGAPACFEVEDALQDLDIPVFHDDQHGTAIVARAAIENACTVSGKSLEDLTIVINGAGAAGTAIAKLFLCVGHSSEHCTPIKDIFMCDTKGIISKERQDLNQPKQALLKYTNRSNRHGDLKTALKDAAVFIGVSRGSLLDAADIKTMAADPIILAMANPIPEIMPEIALVAGASVVGTGRSDFPNQVNNVLVFPGIFRGALDVRATTITEGMKMAAVRSLADPVDEPTRDMILPNPLDKTVAPKIAAAVAQKARDEGVARA